jgi:hypothetical protein
MTLPSRSHSLRQPGYAHRELIDGTRRTTPRAKHLEKTQEWGASEDPQSRPAEDFRSRPAEPIFGNGSGSGQVAQQLSSNRSTTRTYTQSREHRLSARQRSIKGEQNVTINAAAPAGGHSSSSGLPLPGHLSRSSPIRQPADSGDRRDAVKTLHSSNVCVDQTSTGSKLRPVSTTSRSQSQAECEVNTQSIPLPTRASSALKPAVLHGRSRSSGVVLEQGPASYGSGGQDRLTSLERPQFSTYHQRFSPQKQKPPIESNRVSHGTSYANTEVNALTALQDELLQLQWIYSSSHKTLQNWTESGERKIREQSKRHIREGCKLRRIEQSQQNYVNGAAIRDWVGTDGGNPALEKVEVLSRCIENLTELAQPHAKVSRVVEEFEAWYQDTSSTLGERSDDSEWRIPRFIQPLGQPWAATVSMLILSLGACLRNLEDLGSSDASSGLGLVLDSHRRFTKGVLDELTTIEAIHVMVLKQENDWVKDRISALLKPRPASESSPCSTTRIQSAAWHRVP